MNTQHPTYPLQAELTAAITRILESPNASNALLLATREHFEQRRDREFPGWRERYEGEVEKRMNSTGR